MTSFSAVVIKNKYNFKKLKINCKHWQLCWGKNTQCQPYSCIMIAFYHYIKYNFPECSWFFQQTLPSPVMWLTNTWQLNPFQTKMPLCCNPSGYKWCLTLMCFWLYTATLSEWLSYICIMLHIIPIISEKTKRYNETGSVLAVLLCLTIWVILFFKHK